MRCYKFDPAGEDRLTQWMTQNLEAGVVAVEGDVKDIEGELIRELEPPLNLTRWANPHASRIKELRRICADEARDNRERA